MHYQRHRYLSIILIGTALAATTYGANKRALTFDDLMAISRIADAYISPDGRSVAYVVSSVSRTRTEAPEAWIVSVSGEPRQLITSDGNNDTPRWSREGSRIAFLSTRAGAPQIL
jgi:Tol biopolymer transport system component